MLLCLLVGFLAVATSFELGHDSAYHQHDIPKRQTGIQPDYTGPLVPSYNISIPIDHFTDTGAGVYNNRYFINDTFYQPGGPVFFYDYGEQGISNSSAARVLAETNGTTAVMELARQYNGLAILWEHRYYGLSLPFPMVLANPQSSIRYQIYEPQGAPESWQYLTIDQALEDVVYFANNLETGHYQNAYMEQLSPKKTPWIWVGGSYPADRGAWLRQRNPEVIYATWSSSPPTQAMFDGSTYFNGVLRSLPSNCSTDVQAIIPYIDTVISGKQGEEELLKLQRLDYIANLRSNLSSYHGSYNISEAHDIFTPSTFASRLWQAFYSLYQTYGFDYTSRVFCNALESYAPGAPGRLQNDSYFNIVTNPGTSQPSPSGFLAQHNDNLSLGIEAMMYAVHAYQAYYLDFVFDVAVYDSSDSPPNSAADASSWQYQASSQFGWARASNPDNITIISQYFNISYYQQTFEERYLTNATIDALPDRPRVAEVNKYGGWNINPSNTMFTDGQYDPWRFATVYSLESQLGAPGNVPTQEIPACGQPPKNGTRYGTIYPGRVHVSDLAEAWYLPDIDPDDSPLGIGLDLFTKALDVWLPCFGQDEVERRPKRFVA